MDKMKNPPKYNNTRSSSRQMKKWHKWVGLPFAFCLLLFATSGIFLNHRRAISSVDMPRTLLPSTYQYANWNNGSIKSSIQVSADTVFLFGGSGIWLTDPEHRHFQPFVQGMKEGADNRIVNNIIRTQEDIYYAVTTFDLYKLDRTTHTWINQSHLIGDTERFTDLATQGDSLVLMTRSHLYIATYPFTRFEKKELPAPEGYQKESTVFRTLWTLHSGELFGITGKVIVDILGLLVILLCITGILLFLCPSFIKRKKRKGEDAQRSRSLFTSSLKWHNKIGAFFFVFFLILGVSGMFLRPPLLIAIIRAKTKPVPGSVLDNTNPWFDKLRCLRYDLHDKEWILYSSEGFYRFENPDLPPQKIHQAPPVSVMGVNVFCQQDSTTWITASFSGIYLWNKKTGESFDYFTGKKMERKRPGMPTLTNAVSGYSADFKNKQVVFEYGPGARVRGKNDSFARMPEALKEGRISLWHLCLEIHVGRIYTFLPGLWGDLYVFFSGIFFLIVFITGYVIYRRQHKKKKGTQS